MSLPFFNTQAGLHSMFRWNRDQKFKANDWLDYSRADAALPYFDLFLTEKVLASLFTSNSLRYVHSMTLKCSPILPRHWPHLRPSERN
jgi:hypothetical protein